MKGLFGLLIVFGSVGGGYVLSHGQLGALWQPFELIIIGGAAGGAFVLANPLPVLKAAMSGIPGSFKGSPYDKGWYLDLLKLLYELFTKARKEGLMAIEEDVEDEYFSVPDITIPATEADYDFDEEFFFAS